MTVLLTILGMIALVIAFDKYANTLKSDACEEAKRATEYANKKLAEVEQTKVNNQDQNKRLGI